MAPRPQWELDIFQDVASQNACTRYFGAAVDEIVDARIEIDWSAANRFSIAVGGGGHRLDWRLTLTSSVATRLMNATSSVVPEGWWHSQRFLGLMAATAGPMLRAGKLRLTGRVPNGHNSSPTRR